ncbi:hypothetical protein ACRAWD_18230 [Caulobacter segnis]
MTQASYPPPDATLVIFGAMGDLARRPLAPSLDNITPVSMAFHYKDHFEMGGSTGDETLIYDVLIGDPSLFQRGDEIEAAWAGGAAVPDLDGAGRPSGGLRRRQRWPLPAPTP